VLDVVIDGKALTRGSYSSARDVFVGDVPSLPSGSYPVKLRSKNCGEVETTITWNVP
jgi:hypothetical protein